jgi:hypothetical protein
MKKTTRDCYCALCRLPRKLRYSRHLSALHYGQILVLALVFTGATFPFFGFKGVGSLPIIWALFESIHKSLYRKDLKCPYCGFDPKWYKKDVKLARQKVEEFLQQNPDSPVLRRIEASRSETGYSRPN